MLFTPTSASTSSPMAGSPSVTGMSPLFGSSSSFSSSCDDGHDRLIIQRPTSSCDVIYSFDWSDFPVCEDHYVPPSPPSSSSSQPQQEECVISWPDIVAPPVAATTATISTYFFGDETKQQDVDHQHHHLFEVSLSDSDLSSQEGDTESRSSSSAASGTERRRRRNSSAVSFSDQIHVRTHSIVLGDHPCCPNLPLELGWEYEDSTVQDADHVSSSTSSGPEETTAFAPRGSSSSLSSSSSPSSLPRLTRRRVSRRSYLERKALLKQVAGLTEEDIEQLTSKNGKFQNQRHQAKLRSSAPSVSKSLCELEKSWADL